MSIIHQICAIPHRHWRGKCNFQTLLSTAVILMRGKDDNMYECRALLDSCSQSNFITEELCKKLQLKRERVNIPISRLSNSTMNITARTHTTIKSRVNSYHIELPYLIVDTIAQFLLINKIDISQVPVPDDI